MSCISQGMQPWSIPSTPCLHQTGMGASQVWLHIVRSSLKSHVYNPASLECGDDDAHPKADK